MGSTNPPLHFHIAALRKSIASLSGRQLDSLRRGLIDLLTDIADEQAVRARNDSQQSSRKHSDTK